MPLDSESDVEMSSPTRADEASAAGGWRFRSGRIGRVGRRRDRWFRAGGGFGAGRPGDRLGDGWLRRLWRGRLDHVVRSCSRSAVSSVYPFSSVFHMGVVGRARADSPPGLSPSGSAGDGLWTLGSRSGNHADRDRSACPPGGARGTGRPAGRGRGLVRRVRRRPVSGARTRGAPRLPNRVASAGGDGADGAGHCAARAVASVAGLSSWVSAPGTFGQVPVGWVCGSSASV